MNSKQVIVFPKNFWFWCHQPKLSPLLRELRVTHNLMRWGKGKLERQFCQALFERTILHPAKVSPAVRQIHGAAAGSVLKNAYFVEFLVLPARPNMPQGAERLLGNIIGGSTS